MGPRELLAEAIDIDGMPDQSTALISALAEEDPFLQRRQQQRAVAASNGTQSRGGRWSSTFTLGVGVLAVLVVAGVLLKRRGDSLKASTLAVPMGKAEGKVTTRPATEARVATAERSSHIYVDGKGDDTLQATTPADDGNPLESAVRQIKEWEGWNNVLPWVAPSTTTTTGTSTSTSTRTGSTTTTTTTRTTTTRTSTSTTTTTSSSSTFTITTSTTTTTTPCAPVAENDDCWTEVIRAMHRIRGEPGSYADLTVWSTFEEVQSWLHKSGSDKCTLPCSCETATFGDDCFHSVIWAYEEGLTEHPDWYPGLSIESSFGDVQRHLAATDDKCSEPCRPQYTDAQTSLFCFSIVQEDSYEKNIVQTQLRLGAGIFSCDGFAVLSGTNFSFGTGPGFDGDVHTIKFHTAKVGISQDGTAANTLLFMHAWNEIKDKTLALQYDWIVKVDPDAVIVADRVRKHLAGNVGSKAYVRNCNAIPDSPNFPMMFGSLEVISSLAMKEYFEGGEASCKKELDWKNWGEDYFLGKCLDLLGAQPLDNFDMVSDGVCLGVDCSNPLAGAFHPFKDADMWMQCWNQATLNGHSSLLQLPGVDIAV